MKLIVKATIGIGILVVCLASVSWLYFNPLKAESSFTVIVGCDWAKGILATFWMNGELQSYCFANKTSQGNVRLNEGSYKVKIYHVHSGRFIEEFEIFVCRDIVFQVD